MASSAWLGLTVVAAAGQVQAVGEAQPMRPEARSMSAAEALRAHGRMTSIGPDPCRRRAEDEIVVCGRLTNPYATPLYRTDGERYDRPGTTAHAIESARQSFAPCRVRVDPCLKPLPIVTMTGGTARIGQD